MIIRLYKKLPTWSKYLLIPIFLILLIPLTIFLIALGGLLLQYANNIPASFHGKELSFFVDSTINKIKQNDTTWIANNSHSYLTDSGPFREYDSLRARLVDSKIEKIYFGGFSKNYPKISMGYYFIKFNKYTHRTRDTTYVPISNETYDIPKYWSQYYIGFEYNDKRWWISKGETVINLIKQKERSL
jgi:hypothetical protein